jgi:Fur family ferric uptake transcriptional regulator
LSFYQTFRMTPQRKIIIDAFEKMDFHPTADQIYEIVRRQLPRISLGTVYRNLEILSTHNMIKKLEFGGSQKRFDSDVSDHYHLRCADCGRVDDAPDDTGVALEYNSQMDSDYEVIGHRLEFIGICPSCKQSESNSHVDIPENIGKEK